MFTSPGEPMTSIMFRLIAVGLAISAMIVFAGCNTVEGAGQDIQAGGRALEDAAD
jgi:entericidin B